jgi:hypothetical protein
MILGGGPLRTLQNVSDQLSALRRRAEVDYETGNVGPQWTRGPPRLWAGINQETYLFGEIFPSILLLGESLSTPAPVALEGVAFGVVVAEPLVRNPEGVGGWIVGYDLGLKLRS